MSKSLETLTLVTQYLEILLNSATLNLIFISLCMGSPQPNPALTVVGQ